jgi:hypothetical protein
MYHGPSLLHGIDFVSTHQNSGRNLEERRKLADHRGFYANISPALRSSRLAPRLTCWSAWAYDTLSAARLVLHDPSYLQYKQQQTTTSI